jgi:hypothetical protein
MLLPSPLLANTRDRPPKTAMKKNVNTYVPTGKSVFYANFRVKVNDLRTGARTIQVNRATGLPDRCTAQAIANRMRDDVLLGFFDVLPTRENCPTCGQLADRHLAASRAKTAREVAKDFLTLVADRGHACAVASRSPPGRRVLTHPRGVDTHLTSQGYDSAFQATAVRRDPRRLGMRSIVAQMTHKVVSNPAPYSSKIAFECALISLIWSTSIRTLASNSTSTPDYRFSDLNGDQ